MTTELCGWRKSSYSGVQGDCVEVGWSKSSYSGAEGDCIEVALAPQVVGVRDTKDRDGAALMFPRRQWVAFVSGLRARRW
ncbi:DUF397 domain-containing protein [Saccharopolyspora sp. ASAGF58]|uniref:DUF397 domain-containing protein n=1 Tax=Saccharopolyspora sp. ASAGF58 TaxID=2719023 RepID=UPI0014401019|nr:DUF397 domain-containing protein [Saccharopolyspora sp. ASAGF58]QIZ35198.1 DUF397 domain-containing protein [Saccharopolyspora sp. ASAGF58]